MKKIKWYFLAVAFIAIASAFSLKPSSPKPTATKYQATYSDATHWTWSSTISGTYDCDDVTFPNRYCTGFFSSAPNNNDVPDPDDGPIEMGQYTP